MASETITRAFGLKPINYCSSCNYAIVETMKNDFNTTSFCPYCGEEIVSRTSSFPPEVFQRFNQVVNGLIKYGINLPDCEFLYEGTKSVKKFYNLMNRKNHVKTFFDKVGLLERLRRCAAQHAYFAIRGFKQRQEMVSLMSGLFSQKLKKTLLTKNRQVKTSSDFEWLLTDFPNNQLVNEVREMLENEVTTFKTTNLTTNYIINLLRQTRNLLRSKLKDSLLVNANGVVPVRELIILDDLEQSVANFFNEEKTILPKIFLKNLSRLLTNRFKDINQGKGPNWGKGKLDSYIKEVIGEIPIDGLTRQIWNLIRKNWRDKNLQFLEKVMINLNSDELLIEGIISTLKELTPTKLVNNLFGKKNRFRYSTNFDQSWLNYLTHQIKAKTIELIVEASLPRLMSDLTHFAIDLHNRPKHWFTKPFFKAQSIPYGADDKNVFHLVIGNDPRKGIKKSTRVLTDSDDIVVHLVFARKNDQRLKTQSLTFKINEPKRYYDLLRKGYHNRAPTLTKKAGRALTLSFPFEKTSKVKKKKTKKHTTEEKLTLGADLGLKTLVSISIVEGLDAVKQRTKLSKEDFNKL